ncbi:hypothetical protein [Kineococcus gypseus]|uniref:hypothetical protein n=1 Tax=Kineococcus gypseus TaxID=1637102 RepID=UPI003D7DE22D
MTPLEAEVLARAHQEWVTIAEAASIARDQGAEDPLEAALSCALALAGQRVARVGRYVPGPGFVPWPQMGGELSNRLRAELADPSMSDPLEAQSDIMIDAV